MDTMAAMRTTMMNELQRVGEGTADAWERLVFENLTGHSREDVDWDFDDNHAGYHTWIRSFDRFAQELVAEGFVSVSHVAGKMIFRPTGVVRTMPGPRPVYPPQN